MGKHLCLSVTCYYHIVIPFQTHCVTIKKFLSVLPSSVCATINLSESVGLPTLEFYIDCVFILFIMPWMPTDFFVSVKFHSFLIVFVTQSLCASAKNPTAKLKVSKNCPCFPPRFSWFVPLYLEH